MALTLALACAPRSVGGRADRDRDPDPALRHSWVVAPGKFGEANLHMSEGARVEARYEATDVVQWDVHSHPAGQVVIHERGEGTGGVITFIAPSTGVFSILWLNEGTETVKLEIEIEGDVRLDSWTP